MNKRIEFFVDEEIFQFIKQYSQAEQSTMSEVLRGLLTTLKRKEQRRERKSARVQETAPNQLTNFQKEPIHFKFPQRALREHRENSVLLCVLCVSAVKSYGL